MGDFFAAVFYARAILISYIAFILIFAMLAMALFRDTVNADEYADTFSSFRNAFVTGFAFISTTENYAIVYDVFDSEYYTDSHWTVLGPVVVITIFFCIMGMFCWIPLVIDVFEDAFEERKMIHDTKKKKRKTVESACFQLGGLNMAHLLFVIYQ